MRELVCARVQAQVLGCCISARLPPTAAAAHVPWSRMLWRLFSCAAQRGPKRVREMACWAKNGTEVVCVCAPEWHRVYEFFVHIRGGVDVNSEARASV
mmetsp:Transcript_2819/g.7383  ORF Transcript_2819/g.7383 Transcript_2819/m.7383 type:complete len:98 (-) Transcript_2819:266-559(-)